MSSCPTALSHLLTFSMPNCPAAPFCHTISLSHYPTIPLSHCSPVPLSHCPILSHYLTVPLSHCLTIPLSHCPTVPCSSSPGSCRDCTDCVQTSLPADGPALTSGEHQLKGSAELAGLCANTNANIFFLVDIFHFDAYKRICFFCI